MHDHDLDLIAAYADGSLEQDTAEVEELVASCEVCREEYRRQRQVRELLSSLPPVTLSVSERHRLHSEVRRRLDLGPADPTVTPLRPRRSPWWTRVAAVAAAFLVVVVGLGALLRMGMVTGGEEAYELASAETATSAAAAEASTTTAAPAYEAPSSDLGAVPLAEDSTSIGDVPDLGVVDLDEIERALTTQTAATADTNQLLRRRYEEILSCSDQVEGEVVAAVTAVLDGVPVEAYLVTDGADTEVVVLATADCAPVGR